MDTRAARISVPIALVVGLAIAAGRLGEGGALTNALRLAGYPVAVACIVRWLPIVRGRHFGWFLAHQAATVAITVSWVLDERAAGALVNGLWAASAAVWYLRGAKS